MATIICGLVGFKPGLKGTNLPTRRNSSVIKRTRDGRNTVYNTDISQDGYILNAI